MVDLAVPSVIATAMNRTVQTMVQALEQATMGPAGRLNLTVTRAERVVEDIEQVS